MANFAQISSGYVVNVVIVDDATSLDPAFTWVDLTGVTPAPQIGWSYDGASFAAPGLPNTAYGLPVTMTTDGVHDTYHVDGSETYVFAAGTAQADAYLAIAKKENLGYATQSINDFVEGRYSLHTRFSFMAIYTLATTADVPLVNRAAYIKQLFTWAQSVVSYAAAYIATVNALTDAATVASTAPDFSSLVSSDPLVTPVGALAISS